LDIICRPNATVEANDAESCFVRWAISIGRAVSAESDTAGRDATAGAVGGAGVVGVVDVVDVVTVVGVADELFAAAVLLSCTESASTLGLGRASGLAAHATAATTEAIPSRRRIGARVVIPENNVDSPRMTLSVHRALDSALPPSVCSAHPLASAE
jgi:hypothetical protein